MQTASIAILGVGSVGRALAGQILANRQFHSDEYGLSLQVKAVSDSSGSLAAPNGAIEDDELAAILAAKEQGRPLAAWRGTNALSSDSPGRAVEQAGCCAIIADCSASDDTASLLTTAVDAGGCIALANKKPLTQAQATYDRLTRTETGKRALSCARWESTVGSGLPIIATLQRLCASGDRIFSMEGAFSGTLGFVMTGLQGGRLFSEVVREAHAQGFTEPDPRDDLSGLDVARKALILARGAGRRAELKDISVTSLYPTEMGDLTVKEFMASLPQLDEEFAEQCAAASDRGETLRYAAAVGEDSIVVGPRSVPLDSPMGQLSGTDNLVQFSSRWYSPLPLVIRGRGAGVEATAAGVLSDIVELAQGCSSGCC